MTLEFRTLNLDFSAEGKSASGGEYARTMHRNLYASQKTLITWRKSEKKIKINLRCFRSFRCTRSTSPLKNEKEQSASPPCPPYPAPRLSEQACLPALGLCLKHIIPRMGHPRQRKECIFVFAFAADDGRRTMVALLLHLRCLYPSNIGFVHNSWLSLGSG
jgi:hypothetical protein